MGERDRSRRSRQRARQSYMFEGSAVREYETYPSEEEILEARRRRAKARRRFEKQRMKDMQKYHERVQHMSLWQVIAFAIVLTATIICCVVYLNLYNERMQIRSEVNSLQTELSQITNDNVALQEQIDGSADLSKVYKRAVSEFGMTAIQEDQIHYYTNDNQDYVKQYNSIPVDE